MTHIEEIARMAGIRKPGEVEEYQKTSRNGSKQLLEGR
jgi:hypothetical protein